ncbi:MAG: nitrite reductase small subunit NirD [Pseudomonadota bacterium]
MLGSQQIALFRMSNDHVFALGNIDPFSDAAVLSRGIVGDVNGELVVASPIYKQHFRLSDGSCVEDSNVSVGHYLVRVNEGRVAVRAAP